MPRVFKVTEIPEDEKELRRDYFDRHMPRVICEGLAKRGEKFKVKVLIGNEYTHPDDFDHYISTIQLWNRETLLASVTFPPGTLGNEKSHVEVDLYIIPKVSLNLSAMSVCTNHGLWQSEEVPVQVVD